MYQSQKQIFDMSTGTVRYQVIVVRDWKIHNSKNHDKEKFMSYTYSYSISHLYSERDEPYLYQYAITGSGTGSHSI